MTTPPKVCVLVIGDGRDELKRDTLLSFAQSAESFDWVQTIVIDDRSHTLGFCGAIRAGWQAIRESDDDFDYVFHLEEDWRFDREFSLAMMASLLDSDPLIEQVALRRGPANDTEFAAGGVVEANPDAFVERYHYGHPYLWHRAFWTTNPSLYRRKLLRYEWPVGPECEGRFGWHLKSIASSFAYWGARSDEPWITHTGYRTGVGY